MYVSTMYTCTNNIGLDRNDSINMEAFYQKHFGLSERKGCGISVVWYVCIGVYIERHQFERKAFVVMLQLHQYSHETTVPECSIMTAIHDSDLFPVLTGSSLAQTTLFHQVSWKSEFFDNPAERQPKK